MKLPALTPVKVIRALRRAGFYPDRQSGSHVVLYDISRRRRVTVPRHNKDLKKRTLETILEQAELSPEEFRRFL